MICKPWDVIVVPFPFSNAPGGKRRPALVLSVRSFNAHGYSVLAMVTTKAIPPWPGDHPLADLESAGLLVSCIVRLKLFTLDNRIIVKRIGALSPEDRSRVAAQLRTHLPLP